MSTLLDLNSYGVTLSDQDSYAQDEVIDRVADTEDSYDSFQGLDLRSIHHSSDNPLNALYHQVVNPELSLEDRTRAFDLMYRSAYLNKDQICSNAVLGLLKDESLTIEKRFYFLNSIRLQSTHLSVAMHGYVWWFYQCADPLRYKLLSAQFILAHQIKEFPLIKTHILQSQRFLRDVAEDEKQDIKYRSEAADMLIRLGSPNYREIGYAVIHSGVARKTLYDDEQNVHQVSYKESIQKLFSKISNFSKKYSIDEILHHLRTQQNHDACDSLERIVLDTATYHGHTMADILRYVYTYIQESPHKVQLENRFFEELLEMKGWCSTGHIVRLLNTLTGFDSDVTLSVDVCAEIKSALFARLNFALRKLPVDQQEEVTEEFCSTEKSLLLEFVETYSPYEELLEEYRHIDRNIFEEYYQKSLREYLG
jgi:hypothetical protein